MPMPHRNAGLRGWLWVIKSHTGLAGTLVPDVDPDDAARCGVPMSGETLSTPKDVLSDEDHGRKEKELHRYRLALKNGPAPALRPTSGPVQLFRPSATMLVQTRSPCPTPCPVPVRPISALRDVGAEAPHKAD